MLVITISYCSITKTENISKQCHSHDITIPYAIPYITNFLLKGLTFVFLFVVLGYNLYKETSKQWKGNLTKVVTYIIQLIQIIHVKDCKCSYNYWALCCVFQEMSVWMWCAEVWLFTQRPIVSLSVTVTITPVNHIEMWMSLRNYWNSKHRTNWERE